MKNKNRTTLLLILALAVTAAFAAQSAKAVSQIGFTLNLTEVSSTVLTYTYNGPSTFSIINTGPDMWTLTRLTGAATFNANFVADWTEPEEPGEVNEVRNTSNYPSSTLYIVSDLSLMNYYGDITTTFPDGTLVQAGTDGTGPTPPPLFLRFVDQAAAGEAAPPTVPETGSTLGLLGLSGIGLVGLARFRRVQVA